MFLFIVCTYILTIQRADKISSNEIKVNLITCNTITQESIGCFKFKRLVISYSTHNMDFIFIAEKAFVLLIIYFYWALNIDGRLHNFQYLFSQCKFYTFFFKCKTLGCIHIECENLSMANLYVIIYMIKKIIQSVIALPLYLKVQVY